MYDDCSDIVDDVIAIYDNTDESGVHNVTTRRARIVHYLQRTMEDLWFHRSWPFSMNSAALVMVAGEDTLPTDFARISYEGCLLGPSSNRPWTEISFQDMAYLRTRQVEQNRKVFAVGSVIQIPNTASTETFTLIYQKVAPTAGYGGQSGDPTGFPLPFGEALLLGTVAKLKAEEGDPRTNWREDYQKAVARAGALWIRASRASRMPMTVGGMW